MKQGKEQKVDMCDPSSIIDQAGIRTYFWPLAQCSKSHIGFPASLIIICLLSIIRFNFDASSFIVLFRICTFFQTQLYISVYLLALIEVLFTARDQILPSNSFYVLQSASCSRNFCHTLRLLAGYKSISTRASARICGEVCRDTVFFLIFFFFCF